MHALRNCCIAHDAFVPRTRTSTGAPLEVGTATLPSAAIATSSLLRVLLDKARVCEPREAATSTRGAIGLMRWWWLEGRAS